MKKVFLCLLLQLGILHAQDQTLNKPLNDKIFLMTVPKSGTHLMARLLCLLTGKSAFNIFEVNETSYFFPRFDWSDEEFAQFIEENAYQIGRYPFAHFTVAKQAEAYLDLHPEIKVIMIVRDLRDTCVSAAYYFSSGQDLTMDEKLMWVLTNGWGEFEDFVSNIKRHAEKLVEWSQRPNTLLIRFEDLVGPQGGGDLSRQNAAIDRVCSFLGIQLSPLERRYILRNLFGQGSSTFRSGQIGSWHSHFKGEHIQEFQKRMGSISEALGYDPLGSGGGLLLDHLEELDEGEESKEEEDAEGEGGDCHLHCQGH